MRLLYRLHKKLVEIKNAHQSLGPIFLGAHPGGWKRLHSAEYDLLKKDSANLDI